MVPGSITRTSASIQITPPAEGGPFDQFLLAVCPPPKSGAPAWDAAPQVTCAPSHVAGCLVSGLAENSSYVVSGVAYTADGVASARSSAASFNTLAQE